MTAAKVEPDTFGYYAVASGTLADLLDKRYEDRDLFGSPTHTLTRVKPK